MMNGRALHGIKEGQSRADIPKTVSSSSVAQTDYLKSSESDVEELMNTAKPSPDADSTSHSREDSCTSDEGLMINMKDAKQISHGHISPEVHHTDAGNANFGQGMEQILQVNGEESESESASGDYDESDLESKRSAAESEPRTEDGDAMIEYSNSEQVPEVRNHQAQANEANSSHSARILADLAPQEFNAQVRYFHIAKNGEDVDHSTPVRCLVCAQHGHMADTCETLTCLDCGAYNKHITQNCPSSAKCSKCRERGHDRSYCPYKLKKIASTEIMCDLCQRTGHAEDGCELLWRTSGKPWESNLFQHNLRLSCYECGYPGHLGNDCPTRRPGKSLGTSSWGAGKGHILIKPRGGFTIKGVAQHERINENDSEDELAFLHRRKVSKPAQKGRIKINTSSTRSVSKTVLDQSSTMAPQRTSINQPYEQTYDHVHLPYDNGGQGNHFPVHRSKHDASQDHDHGPHYLRSLSQHQVYARNFYNQRYEPPERHEARPPVRGASLYRPMPSAARNQWSRHRT